MNTEKIFLNNIDNINYRILQWFYHLFKHKFNDNWVDKFIDAINFSGSASSLYERQYNLPTIIKYLFLKHKSFEDERIWLYSFNIWKSGWSIFFVTKYNKSRITIEKVLNELKNNEHNDIFLEYASWRDWYSSDGIKVEQYLGKQIFSNYVKEWSAYFIDNKWKTYIWKYEDIIEKEKDCLLLDKIKWKIYINSKLLTSEDIHSQNATISILEILFDNTWKEVFNFSLPKSSYSTSKTQMLSKIIIPLQKTAQKFLKKEVSLSCKGWITEFYLKLEKENDVRIGLVKKI
jgi:hypothetical protein